MQNVGMIDRLIRIVLGLVILAFLYFPPQTPWAWLGLIPLLTGLIGYCPLYSLFKIRTNKQAK